MEEDRIELPPGFRFHPTDEELITHYLSPKVLDYGFNALAIGQVDLNKVEPWDLPWKAKMGEREWYFFCMKDRKYPTGLRTNRATDAGYWKATGKDKEIFRQKSLVGMKKTLVFYRGRAPRGEKTNWVMHEFRLDGKNSSMCHLPKSSKNEWVISRVFNKSGEGKKIDISGLMSTAENHVAVSQSPGFHLPPLTELSSDENRPRCTTEDPDRSSHVTCFSDHGNRFTDDSFISSSSSFKNADFFLHREAASAPNSVCWPQFYPQPDSAVIRELSLRQGRNGPSMRQNRKVESWEDVQNVEVDLRGLEEQEFPEITACEVDLDCLWNY